MRPMATPTLVIPVEGRSSLPFALLHGHSLLHHALENLLKLGPVNVTADPEQVAEVRALVRHERRVSVSLPDDFWLARHDRVLIHDCLCPLAPEGLLRTVAEARTATVAVRPVTDTLKVVEGATIGGTIDRDRFCIVTSPMLLLDVAERPPTEDPSALVTWMRERGEVALVRAPQVARRAADASSVSVMESVDALRRALRED
jgi:hypothetical protein